MTIPVSFPGLGLEFEIPRVAFSIGGINIYWYGVVIGAGMLLAVIMAFTQAARFGVDSDHMIDVIIIGFIFGIVGARVYFIIFSDQTYSTFYDLINLRGGGLAIYGGVIGALVGAVLGCRLRKVPLLPMLDLTAMGFLIGQAFGRWGNFFNQEAFGINTTLPWGMLSPATTAYLSDPSVQAKLALEGIEVFPELPVHPTFLYESLWCALGFIIIFAARKKRTFNGEIGLIYVMWYGIERAVVEGLRTDPLMIGTLRISQLVAITSVAIAFLVWCIARIKTYGKKLAVPAIPPHRAKVLVPTPEGKAPVTIQWPAHLKAPGKKERLELAEEALDAGGVTTIAKIESIVRLQEMIDNGFEPIPEEEAPVSKDIEEELEPETEVEAPAAAPEDVAAETTGDAPAAGAGGSEAAASDAGDGPAPDEATAE